MQSLWVGLFEPCQIAVRTWPRQVVVDQYGTIGRQQTAGEIRSDESGASRDEDMLSATRMTRSIARTLRFTDRGQTSLGPDFVQEFGPAIGALQAIVVFALVGMVRIH